MMKLIRMVVVTLLTMISFSVIADDGETLNWVGCGISKKAYMTELAEGFERKSNIHININGGGATKGIRDVVSGVADLGGSCRFNLPQDPREAGVGLEPVAWDALVVITHRDNPVDTISMDEIKAIYSGEITNWKALGGPDKEILLYTRKSRFSGVGRTLRKLLFADFEKKFVPVEQFKSSGPLEKAVVNTPYSLGVTGISSARLRDLKLMKLGDVYPDYDSIKTGRYQLYRPLYITYNPRSEKMDLVQNFLNYAHSREGREIMRRNGTLPYTEAMRLVMKQLNQDLSAFRNGAILSLGTNE